MNENTSPKKRKKRSKASKAVKTYHISTDIGIGAQDTDISSLYVEVSLDNILNPRLSLIYSLKYECMVKHFGTE